MPRRSRRASLPGGKGTWNVVADIVFVAVRSFSDPLMNFTSSSLGPGAKRKKNSALAVSGTSRGSLVVRIWLRSPPQADAGGFRFGWGKMVQPFLSFRQTGIYRQRQTIHADGRLWLVLLFIHLSQVVGDGRVLR
jgi:hypothetical protein